MTQGTTIEIEGAEQAEKQAEPTQLQEKPTAGRT